MWKEKIMTTGCKKLLKSFSIAMKNKIIHAWLVTINDNNRLKIDFINSANIKSFNDWD